jgi:hypothetical protein
LDIGILTFHDGPNHGAYLQAFALMRVLQNTGHNVTIINYKNWVHHREEGFWQIRKFRRPIRFIDFYKKYKAFRNAHRELNQTDFTTNPEDIKRRHFDLVVFGSDVIWNYKIFGYDDIYFGGLNAGRKVAYAASFGWVDSQEDIDPKVSEGLSRFDSISVRDTNSQEIIKQLFDYIPPITLDPTFIFDFTKVIETKRITKRFRPYLLVYSYVSTENTLKMVFEYARKHELEIIAVGYRQSWCDRVLMNIGPFEWVQLFENAFAVVTSTYHGIIFSIKNRKDVFFIQNEKAFNRVSGIMNLLGIRMSETIREGEVEFISFREQNIGRILEPLVEDSKKWLMSAVNG